MTDAAPNPLRAGLSMVRSIIGTRSPAPRGLDPEPAYDSYARILTAVAAAGPASLAGVSGDLERTISEMAEVDPDRLDRDSALAYWLNLYNATALLLAARSQEQGFDSVLRVPGAFDRPAVTVAGEMLSLDSIEHGKVRRFRDPRIHGALVCGSVSCPTLRAEPYRAAGLDGRLDRQMRSFLASGGYVADRAAGVVRLSRVFSWFGADFIRPDRMPVLLPARRRPVLASLGAWLPADEVEWTDQARPSVDYQSYDWGLRCSVG